MAGLVICAAWAPLLWAAGSQAQASVDIPLFEEAPLPDDFFGYARKGGTQPTSGTVSVVVVFAQFADEGADGDAVPDFSGQLFDGSRPGSFTHFYDAMSFGGLKIEGTVLAGRYASRFGHTAYLARPGEEKGYYARFVQEVLRKADADVDFGRFDNDGPDRVPDSGDDDGTVDYLFVIARSTPAGFLKGTATGVGGLDFEDDFVTADMGASGTPITISGQIHRGTILGAATYSQTVGAMAHEFGHGLGLLDLYDTDYGTPAYTAPADDAAGIGYWGLMGRGAYGWRGDDGPVPFDAWSRERLGWLGPDNDRIAEVRGDTSGLELADLDLGGSVLRLPLQTEITPSGIVYEEYLLLEQRVRRGQHYDRNLPAEGVLVWHVRPQKGNCNDEAAKQVDLVCADGLFADRGFPLGQQPDPFNGRDNLDFWAHSDAYSTDYAGNLGDPTDVFDGVRYTRFDLETNPSTAIAGRGRAASTGLTIRMESAGSTMRVSVTRPRWSGVIGQDVTWLGDVLVKGDLVVAPQARLRIYPSTRVRFAPGTGLRVEGALELPRPNPSLKLLKGRKHQKLEDPVVMEGMGGKTWRGLTFADGSQVDTSASTLVLRDTASAPVSAFEEAEVATAVEEATAETPVAFELGQNYPNPFDGSTRIPYGLAAACDLRLEVFNALGQMVCLLADEFEEAGRHEEEWGGRDDDGRALAGGVYLYRLTVPGQFAASRRMLMLGGMANLTAADDALRQQGKDWASLGRELTDRQDVFGFAPAPSRAQAAYAAGAAMSLLRLMGGRAPGAWREPVALLEDALDRASAAPEQRGAMAALRRRLEEGAVEPGQLEPLLVAAEVAAQEAVGAGGAAAGEVEAACYQVGGWLQHLRAAALAARETGAPLSRFADPAANGQTARLHADLLRQRLQPEGEGAAVAAALEAVARAVEADPGDARGLRDLLGAVAGVARSVGGE